MYKPNLKRTTQQSISTDFSTLSQTTGRAESEYKANLARERTLVPQAFFQQCRSVFAKRNVAGLAGVLNTCEYNYPKAIEDEISVEDPGHIEFHEEIFCFYKQKNVYFWQYDKNNLANITKFLKSPCENVISAISYRTVTFSEFDGKTIKLVAIAYGPAIKFYRLHNFQKQNKNCVAYLQDLLICLYSPAIVTEISILFQQDPQQQSQNNKLSIISGDENGNLMLFDFVTKKKYIVDTLAQKFSRKIKKQSYSQVMQILPYKQFVFCLVKRHYETGTCWKLMQRVLRNPKASVYTEQMIEIYKIETAIPTVENYGKDSSVINRNERIVSFKKYSQYSTPQIIEKMKGSFHTYFEQEAKERQVVELGLIDHISVNKAYVQIMFKSGQSVLVDQEISFARGPKPRVRKPHSLGIIGKYVPNQSYLYQKSHLIKSLGSQLMLYDGFIASSTEQCLYSTPYSYKENTFTIRSVKQWKNEYNSTNLNTNGQFMILGLKGLTLIQQITPTMAIFLYCASMNQQYPYKKYIPQQERFKQQIQKMIEYYGQTQIMIRLIELLKQMKLNEDFKLNIRMDLFEIAIREVSSIHQISYEEAVKCFEENQKKIVKNSAFRFTKDVQEMVWKVVFQLDRTKVEINQNNQWKIKFIQVICVGFQVVISQIFQGVKDWNARKFCTRRNQVYRIICDAHVLSQIIEIYVMKELEYYSKKNASSLLNNTQTLSKNSLNPQKQSLKIKFCLLSKSTLQKLALLLKVYDYVCQMDFHGTHIPKFSDLIFNMDQISRIRFATTITRILGLNNDILIDQLIAKIPELRLDQVRRYNVWRDAHLIRDNSGHIGFVGNLDEQNRTADSLSPENQVEEISSIINQINFREIQEYFMTGLNYRSMNGFASSFEEQRYLSTQWLKNMTALLQISLTKILQLRKQQIQTTNIIEAYTKTSQNYFGLIETSTLRKKVTQLLKQIQFFTDYCEELIQRVFNRYKASLITKEMIGTLLEAIRGQLTIQVRNKIQKGLEDLKLSNLVQAVSRRQLFSNSKPKPYELPSNFIAQQLTYEVARKYE